MCEHAAFCAGEKRLSKNSTPRNRFSAEISVIIISYNHSVFLRTAIESVLSQTFKNIELLIVDDASQDESFEIAKEYEQKHPEMVRALKHPGEINKGIAATLNLGIANARGEYLMFLASDDLLPLDALETLADAIKKNAYADFVYGTADVIDAKGKKTADWITIFDFRHPEEQAILNSGWIPAGQMIKKDCALSVGGFDEDITYGDDWDFWIRVLIQGKGFFINKPVYQYRRHENNITNGFHALNELDILTHLKHKISNLDSVSGSTRLTAVIDLQRAYVYFSLNNHDQAKKIIAETFLENPSLKEDNEFLDQWLVKHDKSWEFKNYIFSEQLSLKKMLAIKAVSREWAADLCAKSAEVFNAQHDYARGARKALESILLDHKKIKNIFLLKIIIKKFLPKKWIEIKHRKVTSLNNLKPTGDLPKANKSAIYYLAPDTDIPSWGIGIIYEHVKILRESGYEAAVLHFDPPFRVSWCDASLPIYYLHQHKQALRADDVLIIPEVLAHIKELQDIPSRKIIHVQNVFYIEAQNQGGEGFKNLKPEACLTIMPHCKDILEKFYEIPVSVVPPFVAPYFYFTHKNWNSARTKTVLFYPKSASQDCHIIINYLKRWMKQNRLDWNVVEIRNKQHHEVSYLMKQSAFFVNANCREAFNTSVPEAMAAGCLVLCYEAYGGRDFLKDGENAFVFSNNDIYSLIGKLCELITEFDNNKAMLSQMRKQAFETANRYTKKETESALLEFYAGLKIVA